MNTFDAIFQGEAVEELERAMLLRAANRARDAIVGAFLAGVFVGIVLTVVLHFQFGGA